MSDQPQNATPDAVENGKEETRDLRAELLADLHQNPQKYRLPPELKEQILKERPSIEEEERQLRELMEQGGSTFEEMLASFPEELRKQL